MNRRLFATGFYQGPWTGEAGAFTADDGRGTRFLTGGHLDALIDFDTTRLGLGRGGGLRGGGLHVLQELEGGRFPGFRGGALWPVNTGAVLPLDTPEEHEASPLCDSQRWGGTSLLLGKVNAALEWQAGSLWWRSCELMAACPLEGLVRSASSMLLESHDVSSI